MRVAVVLLVSLLLVAILVQDAEAGFFRRLGSRIKQGVRRVGEKIKKAGTRVVDAIKDHARDRVRDELHKLIRGKRSALTLNRPDDVNAIDIANTFNLDLPAVQDAFVASDVDKSGSLDGQEVIVFLSLIESLVDTSNKEQTPTKH